MSASTVRPAARVPIWLLIAVLVVVGTLAGAALGYALGTGQAAAEPVAAQVVADNALVDRLHTAIDTGNRADFDAIVRPNVHFSTDSKAEYTFTNAEDYWSLLQHAVVTDHHVHARTSDVTRFDSVLAWSGTYHSTRVVGPPTRFAWLVRLDATGRIGTITETTYGFVPGWTPAPSR